nr:RING-H2 finger protein ATL67-like [Tanacetum cinerariifolium]
MSTTFQPPSSLPSSTRYYITNLGLGYAIAIAFGFLVLFSSLLLASYICLRHRNTHHNYPGSVNHNHGLILPSIIFLDDNTTNTNNVSTNDNETNVEHGMHEIVVVGLDQDMINTYPKFPFTKSMLLNLIDSTCAICLCEYKEGEMMRMLPECKHCFHLSCVDAWLKLNASCPVCRSSPLPTPLSTPLAEVVPLSQFADGRRRRRAVIYED